MLSPLVSQSHSQAGYRKQSVNSAPQLCFPHDVCQGGRAKCAAVGTGEREVARGPCAGGNPAINGIHSEAGHGREAPLTGTWEGTRLRRGLPEGGQPGNDPVYCASLRPTACHVSLWMNGDSCKPKPRHPRLTKPQTWSCGHG